jgi:thioredoxin 1
MAVNLTPEGAVLCRALARIGSARTALSRLTPPPYNADKEQSIHPLRQYPRNAISERRRGMASANVIELTTANWEKEVVQSDKPVLVDFWAVWCGPCRALAPTIDKIADQFAGKVKVGKLNTDEAQEIAIKYGISAIPQILLFKGGSDKPIDKQIGNQPMDNIVKMLNRALEA